MNSISQHYPARDSPSVADYITRGARLLVPGPVFKIVTLSGDIKSHSEDSLVYTRIYLCCFFKISYSIQKWGFVTTQVTPPFTGPRGGLVVSNMPGG